MLLVARRQHLPNDIVHHVAKFLPRTAWPDYRACCWCDDCIIDNSMSLMQQKLVGDIIFQTPKSILLKPCAVCQVALYKNSEHAKKEAGSHRKVCNRPPFRIPGQEEEYLCKAVEASFRGDPLAPIDVDLHDLLDGEESDEDDWESIHSDDEEDVYHPTVTNLIYDFFYRKAYKSQLIQDSAFQAMYTRDE